MMFNDMASLGKAVLLALILAWMAPAWGHAAGSAEVPTAQDFLMEAKAAEAGRLPILVIFSRPNCPYCKRVLNEFLEPMQRNPEYRGKVMMRQVIVGSHARLRDFTGGTTTHNEFAKASSIGMVPVIKLYDSWGNTLTEPLTGFTSPDYYGEILDQRIDEALAKIRK